VIYLEKTKPSADELQSPPPAKKLKIGRGRAKTTEPVLVPETTSADDIENVEEDEEANTAAETVRQWVLC
jgi:hypothetical protein